MTTYSRDTNGIDVVKEFKAEAEGKTSEHDLTISASPLTMQFSLQAQVSQAWERKQQFPSPMLTQHICY
jgi:hypothetical protein